MLSFFSYQPIPPLLNHKICEARGGVERLCSSLRGRVCGQVTKEVVNKELDVFSYLMYLLNVISCAACTLVSHMYSKSPPSPRAYPGPAPAMLCPPPPRPLGELIQRTSWGKIYIPHRHAKMIVQQLHNSPMPLLSRP